MPRGWNAPASQDCAVTGGAANESWNFSPSTGRLDGMAQLRDIVIDCSHPASLARFWAAAVDGYAIAPYDDAEIARLRSLGIYDLEDDPSVLLEGPGPRLFLQRVPEAKQVKNRVHLDLASPSVDAEVTRLVGIGASVVERYESHVTLADPQGNEFCVTLARDDLFTASAGLRMEA